MYLIDTLHESMDGSLQRLAELAAEERPLAAGGLISSIEADLTVERRLLGELNIRVPGLSGIDPLSMLQRAEVERLLVLLKEADGHRWVAALAELRLQLEAAFVTVDQALDDRE